jgi:hypothetical protein
MARSGVITITATGTAVRGPDVPGNLFAIAAHPANNNGEYILFGNDGANDVAETTGFPAVYYAPVYIHVTNLNELWFDSPTNGNKACWLKVN